MNKIKNLLIILLVLFLIGLGSFVYFIIHSLSEGINTRHEDLISKIKKIENKVDAIYHSHELLEKRLSRIEGEQNQIQKQIQEQMKDYSNQIDLIQSLTDREIKNSKILINNLEEKTQQWLKESLSTLAVFENNLSLKNKDIDSAINFQLPKIEKDLELIKKQQDEFKITNDYSKKYFILEGKLKKLEEQVTDIKEKTLDVILRSKSSTRL